MARKEVSGLPGLGFPRLRILFSLAKATRAPSLGKRKPNSAVWDNDMSCIPNVDRNDLHSLIHQFSWEFWGIFLVRIRGGEYLSLLCRAGRFAVCIPTGTCTCDAEMMMIV